MLDQVSADRIAKDPNALRQMASELRKKAEAAEAEAQKVESAPKVGWSCTCSFVQCFAINAICV
jgi:hypothetical protein